MNDKDLKEKIYLMGFVQAQLGNGKDEIDVRFNLLNTMRDHKFFKHLTLNEMNPLIDEAFENAKLKSQWNKLLK